MSEETAKLLDIVKDALGSLGEQVLAAYSNDGRVSRSEMAMIGLSAITYLLPIANAIMALSKTGIREFLDTLSNSDLVPKDTQEQ